LPNLSPCRGWVLLLWRLSLGSLKLGLKLSAFGLIVLDLHLQQEALMSLTDGALPRLLWTPLLLLIVLKAFHETCDALGRLLERDAT